MKHQDKPPRLCLLLPYPPSVNNYYTHTRRGVFLSQGAKAFRASVVAAIIDQTGKINWQFPGIYNVEVEMDITLYPPTLKRKRDGDNNIKALWDALQHAGVIEDDSRIKPHHVYPGVTTPGGACLIVITPGSGKRRGLPKLPNWWKGKYEDIHV